MKQIFYKGLLALTIAFGMTSCDKNMEVADVSVQELADAGLASKVTFGESGIELPGLKSASSESGKSHSGFTHMYSPASQVLSIVNAAGVEKYTGDYTANNISSIIPSSIILENGDYIATSSNASNSGMGVVGSFLPYTSTKSFNLSESTDITLVATLERGFLIVNAEAEAADADRVQSAIISVDQGDGTATEFDLIEDGDGDYYAYLEAGSYNVEVTYLLDGVAKVVRGTKAISNGLAYTLNLALTAETEIVLGTESDVSSETFIESAIPADSPAPAFVNEDNDLLDTVSRVVTSTFTTTDSVRDADQTPSIVYGEWMVIATNNDLGFDGESGTGTGDGGSSTGDESDADDDDETPADTTAPVITLSSDVPADGGLTDTDYIFTITSDDADAVIVWSKNSVVVSGESGLTYTTSFGNAIGDKTVSVSVTDAAGNATTMSLDVTISEPVIADTPDSGAWSVNAGGTAAVWVVTRGGNADDATPPAPVAAPGADLLAAGKQYVDGDGFADLSVAIEDIPAADAEWTTSTVSMELYGVVYTTLYSNTDFALDFVIDVDALSGGQVSYQLVNASLSGDARAIGDLVAADSVDEAIAAAKAYIAAN